MVSFVSLQSVLAVLGVLILLNLIGLALVMGHRRRIEDVEAAIEEQVETVAGTLEAGLAEEVEQTEQTVGSLTDTVEDVHDDIRTLGDRLPEVERTLARLDGRLDGFSEGGLAAIEDRLEAVQDDLAHLEDTLGAVDSTIGETSHTLTDLEQAFAALETEVDRVVAATTDGNAGPAVAQDLAELKRRLTAIEGLLTDRSRTGVNRGTESSPDSGGEDAMNVWISGTEAESSGRDVTADTATDEDMWTDSPTDGTAREESEAGSDFPDIEDGNASDEDHGFDLPGEEAQETDPNDDDSEGGREDGEGR